MSYDDDYSTDERWERFVLAEHAEGKHDEPHDDCWGCEKEADDAAE